MSETKAEVVVAGGAAGAAKWLVAAAGGIAAAAVAGLQFGGLANARNPWLAVAGFVAVLAASGLVMARASQVLLPAYDSLNGLGDLEYDLETEYAKQELRPPQKDPTTMQRLATTSKLYLHLSSMFAETPHQLLIKLQTATPPQQDELLSQAQRTLATCNAFEARQRFAQLRRALMISGGVLAIAVPIFAVAISPVDTTTPETLAIDMPVEMIVVFGASPSFGDADSCRWEELEFDGIAIGGTFGSPAVRLPPQHGCSGGVVRLRQEDTYRMTS